MKIYFNLHVSLIYTCFVIVFIVVFSPLIQRSNAILVLTQNNLSKVINANIKSISKKKQVQG